jgi:hypothetical protein
MTIDRKTLLAIVAAVAVGYWLAGSKPEPTPDRPVLRWVVRAAKSFLWIALVAEEPPAELEQTYLHHDHVGADGYRLVDHGRGW